MLRVCFTVGCCLFFSATCQAEDAEKKTNPLQLTITAKEVKVGERQTVGFNVELTNTGDKPITVVQPGDGSCNGWRTPTIAWAADGTWPDPKVQHPRCGNINALGAAEVVDLAPGKSLQIGDWAVGSLSSEWKPGRHTVTLRYKHVPDLVWKGLPLGVHDEPAMKRIRASRPLIVESDPYEFEVDDAGRLVAPRVE
jgi:hypothetical protein